MFALLITTALYILSLLCFYGLIRRFAPWSAFPSGKIGCIGWQFGSETLKEQTIETNLREIEAHRELGIRKRFFAGYTRFDLYSILFSFTIWIITFFVYSHFYRSSF